MKHFGVCNICHKKGVHTVTMPPGRIGPRGRPAKGFKYTRCRYCKSLQY